MNFHPESKVWVYQSDRFFSDQEMEYLHSLLSDFTKGWTAHQQQLKAGYAIEHRLFIVLIVDESMAGASGCSIDKSVHLMKQIEGELGLNLFDRFRTAWRKQDEIQISDRNQLETLLDSGEVNGKTTVFNNLIKTYQEFQESWETPLENSWHARVFNVATN